MDDEKLKVILGNTVSSSSAKSIRNLISLKKKPIDGQIGMVSINLFLGYFILFYFMYGLMQPRLVLHS